MDVMTAKVLICQSVAVLASVRMPCRLISFWKV